MDPNQEKVDTTFKGNESNPAQTVAEGKGKGKAVDIAPQDVSMGEDDSSSDEETGAEDEVRNNSRQCGHFNRPQQLTSNTTDKRRRYASSQSSQFRSRMRLTSVALTVEEADDDNMEEIDTDNMEEIDTDNIIPDGRRTRGKTIDFAEAAKNAGDELEDDEDDEDDDFEEKDEEMHG